jgi:DNA repair protein SbcC/Rad50
VIFQTIRLHPFAGFSDLELAFEPGLNVLIGPNEAGKSTVFTGLQRVLFTPSRLHKRDFDAQIAPLLPIGSGDTISVTLGLATNGSAYTLQRTWGGTKSEILTLPNGTQVTDVDNIAAQLEGLLPAKEGTFNSVLMTYQSGLSTTLDDLKSEADSVQTLGTILRRTVYETDGVQVDLFREEIAKRYNDYFARWDRESGRPENESREYKVGIGQILGAYYDRRHAREDLEKAQSYEEQIDVFNQNIAAYDEEIEQKTKFVAENQVVVDSLQNRRVLSSELETTLGRIERYGDDNGAWPLADSKVLEIQAQLPSLREKESALIDEREKSKVLAQNQDKHKRFQVLKTLKQEWEKEEAQAEGVQVVTEEEIEELKGLENEIRMVRSELSSGAFHFKFKAHKDLSISVQTGLEDPTDQQINADALFESDAQGFLKLKHTDWEIEVQLAEEDIEAKRQHYSDLQQKRAELFEKHEVETLEKATELNQGYEKVTAQIAYAKRRFEESLGDDTLEDLQAELGDMDDTEDVRSEVDIVEALSEVQRQIGDLAKELSIHQEKLDELIERYDDKRTLLLNLAKETQNQEETQKQIDQLVPVPEGVDDIEIFAATFNETKISLEEKRDERNTLLLERKDFEKTEPEFSAEELQIRSVESETQYERVLRTGESIGQIYDLTSQLAEEMDTNTYQGLEENLSRYVSIITDKRYSKVDMDQSMPQGFIRNDGEVLPYRLLSAGTRDVLALSLRLSMAQYFLQESEGVLVLDDPFVDLDPKRQEMGAEVIKEFASDKQVILFTCHPSHADLLGGNRINLDPLGIS